MINTMWYRLRLMLCLLFCGAANAAGWAGDTTGTEDSVESLLQQHCVSCHAGAEPAAGLSLPAWDPQQISAQRGVWERVLRRLQNGDMPPGSAVQPDPRLSQAAAAELTAGLDAAAARQPFRGPVETLRRLTRTEYRNAVRDLLAIEIDAAALLPADESSHGFDNITVTGLSPTLLSRYIAAAEKISPLALGRPEMSPGG
ncbi:MAG: DUF1587 domain-containing protein [Planctomyces sp.]